MLPTVSTSIRHKLKYLLSARGQHKIEGTNNHLHAHSPDGSTAISTCSLDVSTKYFYKKIHFTSIISNMDISKSNVFQSLENTQYTLCHLQHITVSNLVVLF